MAFEKGQSGNPGGRPKEKQFTDALRLAVNREADDGRKKLAHLADRLVTEALAGEGWAMQQIADRLDGKVPQAVIGGEEGDPAVSVIHTIRRIIVDPRHSDGEGVSPASDASQV